MHFGEQDSQLDSPNQDTSLMPIHEWGNRITNHARELEKIFEVAKNRYNNAKLIFERDIQLAELIRDGGFINDIEIQRDKLNRRIFLVNDKRLGLPENEDDNKLEETLGNMADQLFLKANKRIEHERKRFSRAQKRYQSNIMQLIPGSTDFSEAMYTIGIARIFSDNVDRETKSIVLHEQEIKVKRPKNNIEKHIQELGITLDNIYEVYTEYVFTVGKIFPIVFVNILFNSIKRQLIEEFDEKIGKGEISPLYRLSYQTNQEVHPEDLKEF